MRKRRHCTGQPRCFWCGEKNKRHNHVYQKLIININRINVRTKLSDDTTIMEAIAKRDMLKLRQR
ncbi:DIP1984 family protein [Desulfotruncus arcticus]|uniref:DIP1984 family protein n=1 Tax=Desulfotruncus arcticus TaxID=341036 RepID=UPI000B81237C